MAEAFRDLMGGLRMGFASNSQGKGRRIKFTKFNGVNITDAAVQQPTASPLPPTPPPPKPSAEMTDMKEISVAAGSSAPVPTKDLTYTLFFDFECTGLRPWAVAMAVIGFPADPALFETGITCEDRIMIAYSANPSDFNASTRSWWFSPEMDAARQHITFHAMHVTDNDCWREVVAAFVNLVRSKFPGIRFATDNPTLDARYLDNIMDSNQRDDCDGTARISLTGMDECPWRRVLAVDDLRDGFLMASPHLKCIPQRPNCPLRYQARVIPNHAPDGDLLRIAADYGDLLAASAAAAAAGNKMSKQ